MRVGECPSCRAPVEFRPGAGKVKVCDYCHTVVLRGEANLETLGKLAELTDTQSPLKVGLSGAYDGRAFTVAGRLQKTQGTAVWDEWYLTFDDQRVAWLSESEGEWNLMFPLTGVPLPLAAELKPLASFELKGQKFVVEEVGEARTLAAEGQLPDFNREHVFCDATAAKGGFCSLDYGDGGAGEAFLGTRVGLPQLGFDKADLAPTPKKDALKQARCTNCNGPLALKAPDATKRVACPYCGALLEVAQGELAFLQLLEKPPYEPVLPLGTEGTLATTGKTTWTVLAFLIRSTLVESTRYPWEEYLLWNQKAGFRWLMNANGHWTLLTPIAAGDVELVMRNPTFNGRAARWNGKHFRAYQSVYATTDYVAGECYWQVAAGEQAEASEYVEPPESINLDEVPGEVTFTHGVMIDPAEVKDGFKLKAPMPTPQGIAPAQVNPHKRALPSQFGWAALWTVLFIALLVIFSMRGDTHQFTRTVFTVPPDVKSGSPESQQFSEPFAVTAKVPLEVTLEADYLANDWLAVQLDLVNEDTGEVIQVSPETEYYSGVTDGESWSEGSRSATKQTSEVEPGRYTLRATPMFQAPLPIPRTYLVKVAADSGVGLFCPFLVFVLLIAGPLITALRSSSFETRKWNDAVFQMAPNVSTFPYAKQEDDE